MAKVPSARARSVASRRRRARLHARRRRAEELRVYLEDFASPSTIGLRVGPRAFALEFTKAVDTRGRTAAVGQDLHLDGARRRRHADDGRVLGRRRGLVNAAVGGAGGAVGAPRSTRCSVERVPAGRRLARYPSPSSTALCRVFFLDRVFSCDLDCVVRLGGRMVLACMRGRRRARTHDDGALVLIDGAFACRQRRRRRRTHQTRGAARPRPCPRCEASVACTVQRDRRPRRPARRAPPPPRIAPPPVPARDASPRCRPAASTSTKLPPPPPAWAPLARRCCGAHRALASLARARRAVRRRGGGAAGGGGGVLLARLSARRPGGCAVGISRRRDRVAHRAVGRRRSSSPSSPTAGAAAVEARCCWRRRRPPRRRRGRRLRDALSLPGTSFEAHLDLHAQLRAPWLSNDDRAAAPSTDAL